MIQSPVENNFKMLRFFSRRKPKGRKDQRYGSGGYSNVGNGTSRKPLGPTSKHKHLECKVIFLDGEDETFHITVSLQYHRLRFVQVKFLQGEYPTFIQFATTCYILNILPRLYSFYSNA